jgi:ABC-type sugar transport system substrate-binding protein
MTGGSGRGPDEVGAPRIRIGLVTKTDTNPYFIRIREAAIATAGQWRGAQIVARAGKFDGDNAGQVAAVDGSCPGVLSVRASRYVATVMQFPTAIAQDGVNAVRT